MTGDNAINKPADTARGADNAIRSQLRASASAAASGASAGARAAPGNLPAPDVSRPAADGPRSATAGDSTGAIRGEQPGNALNPDLVAATQEAGSRAAKTGASSSSSDSGNGERARQRAEEAPPGQAGEAQRAELRQRAAPFRYGFLTSSDAPVSAAGNHVPLGSGLADKELENSVKDQLVRESRPQLFAVGGRVDLQAVQQGISGIVASLTGREPSNGDELGETDKQTSAQREVEEQLEGEDTDSRTNRGGAANDEAGANADTPAISERLQAIFGEAVARYDGTAQALGGRAPTVGLELTG